MTDVNRWLLPDGVDEMLPPQAWKSEYLRRTLLDLYRGWVMNSSRPLIEFLESLYTGTGNDLDLQTFKLTDQLSGRMMGVRLISPLRLPVLTPTALSGRVLIGSAMPMRCCTQSLKTS